MTNRELLKRYGHISKILQLKSYVIDLKTLQNFDQCSDF